jgi:adenosylcobinamide-GDP ribazoletransferase
MNAPLHGFLSTLSLVSRIPAPLRSEPDYSAVGFWMPVVGTGAAAFACAGAWLGTLAFGPGMLAAACAIAAQYVPFNLFHLDGLLDTADAAGVFGDAERRRAVLKDPRIGSFALFAGFLTLSCRLGAVSALLVRGGPAAWGALALAPASGRLGSILVTAIAEPYAEGGLAATLGRPSPVSSTIGYAIAAVPAAILFGAAYGPVGAVAAMLVGGLAAITVAAFVAHWYSERMGGYSGDALGAAVELGELLVLLLAAAVAR